MKRPNRKKIKSKRQRASKLIYFKITFASLALIALTYMVSMIPPARWQSIFYAPFFTVLSFLVFFSISTFVKKIIIPIIITLAVNSTLILRLFGFKEFYYPFLIIGLAITLIYFFTLPEEDGKVPADSSNNKTDKDHGTNIQEKSRSSTGTKI